MHQPALEPSRGKGIHISLDEAEVFVCKTKDSKECLRGRKVMKDTKQQSIRG